jgi:hypothetical protein
MTLHEYPEVEQGSEQWHDLRRGIVTASTIKSLITAKTVQVASNIESRSLTATLVAERVNGFTDDNYVSFDMARGHEIEPLARELYAKTYGTPVTEMGFMIREDDRGYLFGYSPDGLVLDTGLIETKCRRPKEHIAAVIADEVPAENMAQIQGGLFVTNRRWCDYLSYSPGMAMWRKRVYPDPAWFEAIALAVEAFETAAAEMEAKYLAAIDGCPTTERINYDVAGITF